MFVDTVPFVMYFVVCSLEGCNTDSSETYYSILFYSILFYSILFYSILFYPILFYLILFYSILFYSILFYSILYYSEFSVVGISTPALIDPTFGPTDKRAISNYFVQNLEFRIQVAQHTVDS